MTDKVKQEWLLAPDTRADFVDSVIELNPDISTKLQNTIINLVDLVAKAQLAKAEPPIRQEGFAQGIEHYRKVILPVMVGEARQDERERITEEALEARAFMIRRQNQIHIRYYGKP